MARRPVEAHLQSGARAPRSAYGAGAWTLSETRSARAPAGANSRQLLWPVPDLQFNLRPDYRSQLRPAEPNRTAPARSRRSAEARRNLRATEKRTRDGGASHGSDRQRLLALLGPRSVADQEHWARENRRNYAGLRQK